MSSLLNRRHFLKSTAAGVAAAGCMTQSPMQLFARQSSENWFEISLAQWSLHKALFAKEMDHLDFAKVAKEEFGISAIEYVNQFFKDKALDEKYLAEMNKRAADHGVQSLLIMCDGEGRLGDPNSDSRKKAVENHYKWLSAAKELGCHSIRVNAASAGEYEEQVKLAADGLAMLSEKAKETGLNVIVENHGGLSSNGGWLSKVMKTVDMENCGTLPDFGNFRISGDDWYDRYQGVEELMPFAKAVSAKTHDFDEDGMETKTDYVKMLKIVKEAGYTGFIGIEYEGGKVSEKEGIKLSKTLLEKAREATA